VSTAPRPAARTVARFAIPLTGLVISVAAVWLALRGVDLARMASLIGQLRPGPLVLVGAAVAAQLWVRSVRWSRLLARRDGGAIPARRLVPVVLVGYLGNAVLPARLGDPVRAALVGRREGIPASTAFGSVVLERVIDTLTLALIALPAAIWAGAPDWFFRATAIVAVAAGGVLLAAQTTPPRRIVRALERRARPGWRPWLERVDRFLAAMDGRGRERALAAAAGLSLLAWILDGTIYWAVGQALGIDLSLAGAMVVSAVTVLGTIVPSAPGYVGTFELAASAAAGWFGVAAESALAFAIVVHALTVFVLAIGGALSLVWLGIAFGDLAREPSAETVAPAASPTGRQPADA